MKAPRIPPHKIFTREVRSGQKTTSIVGVLIIVFGGAVSSTSPTAAADTGNPTRLFVKEVPLRVLGRDTTVIAVEQADGTQGYQPQAAAGFQVEVVNQLKVPTAMHWHGLILPNLMDGVPFITQEPIQPGGVFRYNFPFKQSGTYWMHSHYGLQEQYLAAAPLIIWTDEERSKAARQYVVDLTDFSFTPPADILKNLKKGMPMPAAGTGGKKAAMPKMGAGPAIEMKAQVWKDDSQSFSSAIVRAPTPDVDVSYDALLANRRTLDDPEVLSVNPGETVLLRLIAAASSTSFQIDTGTLMGEIVAVDGKGVQPLKGNIFQLATAQRLDLRFTIPSTGGAFPILAQGEGTKLLCGVVLSTPGAKWSPKSPTEIRAAIPAALLDNTQERRLRALHPLTSRPPDRSLPAVLGGNMMKFIWTINGRAYPNRDALVVRRGERVQMIMTNQTQMGHPMHLHGHDFQVVAIDGEQLSGALRDTVMVPPGSSVTIAFDADNPGVWAFHCHLLYHLASGMFTVVKYEDADTRYWTPEKTTKEILGLR
ncbi:MAG TPA: multicopper oxidase domain-containing protein [Verrucomicrobiota bacterium]|nr:multicopper oxidase domain-containing protein [Verrucomicrobiota bacterium]